MNRTIALDFSTLDTLSPGSGQYRYVIDLVRGLADAGSGYTFALIGSRPEILPGLADLVRRPEWRYVHWPRAGGWASEYRNHVGLARLLRRERVDLLHALHGFVPVIAPCAVVATVYDLMYELFPDYALAVRSRPYRIQRWGLQHRARRLIAISHTTAEDAVRLWGIPPGRIDVVPLGCALADATGPARAAGAAGALAPFGVPDGTPTLGAPMNLEPRKNLTALLRAVARLREAVPELRLLLHGRAAITPPRQREFDRIVAELDLERAVIQTGVLDDTTLGALYGGVTAYVFPSLYEGFGLPLLEAMARGACVVARGASAMAELVGDAGVLVAEPDAEGFAAAILPLLSDPDRCRRLGARAIERAARYTVTRMVTGTLASYDRALEQPARGAQPVAESPSGADVSVVVLSYDRPHLLPAALAALEAQRPAPREILVVDNPSPRSAEVDRVVLGHPGVRLIRPPRNLGFAGGMNLGLAAASGRHVFLTEDDIIVEDGALAALAARLDAAPSCGLCAGVMLNHGAGTVRAAGMRIALGGVFRQENLRADAPDDGAWSGPYAVDALPGAGVMGRRDQLTELGGFRAEFFMYYEDVELCARIRARGWTVDIVPAARARHVEPPPGRSSAALEFHKMKNLAATYLLHAPTAVLPEFGLRYGVLVPLRTLLRDPRRGVALARGFWWAGLRAPRLLRERRRVLYSPP